MTRLKFKEQSERESFFRELKNRSGLRSEELAKMRSVSARTFRDWSRGKYLPSTEHILFFSSNFGIPVPVNVAYLEEKWHLPFAASKGGFARQEKHGLLGNIETRKKGGLMSQKRRTEDPKKYKKLGCNVRKEFNVPRFSEKLAEAVGIILGDGEISDNQVKISLGAATDLPYAKFVENLFCEVFKERPSSHRYKNAVRVSLSGVELVSVLEKLGLVRGNKVKHQVGIPQWIKDGPNYKKSCVRGLFDTDGGLYSHSHSVKGEKYKNIGLSFCSHSEPLLNEFFETLLENGIAAKKVKWKVYIYSVKEITRFFSKIGSHNPKNHKKLSFFVKK
jgi:intein/homing endonuclease